MIRIKLGFIGLVLALVGVLLAGSSSAQDGPTLTADDPSSVELEVRIAARGVAGGRVEFGLQSRQVDGSWSDRLLPEKRYFPIDTGTGRWLSSSPLTLQSVELEVRIVARGVAGGRVEFGLQSRRVDGSWSDRLLPEKRYFPIDTGTGSWLFSSSLPLQLVPEVSHVVPEAPLGLSAEAGIGEVVLEWSPGGDGGSPITGWQYRVKDADQEYGEWMTVPGGAGILTWTVAGLEGGGAYRFEVRALNQVGAGPVTEVGPVAPLEALTVEMTPTSLSATSFQVAVNFARPVNDFDQSDIIVSNGLVTDFSGSGAQYEVTVEPRAAGAVVVRIPKGVAQDATDTYNQASSPYVANSNFAEGPGFDTWNRAAVIDAMVKEFDRVDPDPEFTGNVENCIAGTTSQQFRDSVIQRVNWYRQMAGINPVSENLEYSKDAQAAALIMSANHYTDHSPGSDRACYTESGYMGASRSNLSISSYGIDSIDLYMQDPGYTNVRHRMWIIDPWVINFGTGDIPTTDSQSNALYVIDHYTLDGTAGYLYQDDPEVRQERGFVAWPPPGYTTANTNWGRWSFSLENLSRSSQQIHDLSLATVTVMDDDGPVQADIISRSTLSIVWAMNGDTESKLQPRPTDGDHCYTITISNILVKYNNIAQVPYEYTTCIIDVGSQFNKEDREALIALYHSTDGPNWANNQNWLTNKPLGTWYGVTTDLLFDRVFVLDLSFEMDESDGIRYDLNRKIPPEIGKLTKLEWLDLPDNQLSGSIPSELGNLTKLWWLNLSDNELSGPVPPELSRLTKLRRLDLSDNQLSGSVPPEFGDLTNLEYLILHSNELSGPVPLEFGDLINLGYLGLHSNELSGLVPPELSRLTKLWWLDLSDNQLSGPVPPELSRLTELRRLDLSGNQLSGPVPPELANKFPDLL